MSSKSQSNLCLLLWLVKVGGQAHDILHFLRFSMRWLWKDQLYPKFVPIVQIIQRCSSGLCGSIAIRFCPLLDSLCLVVNGLVPHCWCQSFWKFFLVSIQKRFFFKLVLASIIWKSKWNLGFSGMPLWNVKGLGNKTILRRMEILKGKRR